MTASLTTLTGKTKGRPRLKARCLTRSKGHPSPSSEPLEGTRWRWTTGMCSHVSLHALSMDGWMDVCACVCVCVCVCLYVCVCVCDILCMCVILCVLLCFCVCVTCGRNAWHIRPARSRSQSTDPSHDARHKTDEIPDPDYGHNTNSEPHIGDGECLYI